MTMPWTNVYFVGRAIAEVLTEKANQAATEVLSELGKLDAERREATREFIQEVNARAAAAQQSGSAAPMTTTQTGTPSGDLQATIDDLRAEIAETRAELQRYRSGTGA
jgi:uncharacterized protein YceH (UPF0502 family)